MQRNWDIIREVLIEVEALKSGQSETIEYGPASESDHPEKDDHAILLWKSGFIEGINTSTMDGDSLEAQGLTWKGHELLDTIRSKPVWDRIKKTATEKGIELTFDAIKLLGKTALTAIIGD